MLVANRTNLPPSDCPDVGRGLFHYMRLLILLSRKILAIGAYGVISVLCLMRTFYSSSLSGPGRHNHPSESDNFAIHESRPVSPKAKPHAWREHLTQGHGKLYMGDFPGSRVVSRFLRGLRTYHSLIVLSGTSIRSISGTVGWF